MKKIYLLICSVFILSAFNKQEIILKTDSEMLENLKTEIIQIKTQEEALWAIFDAVKSNDYAGVEKLLKQGARVNQRDWANNTPLMYAAVRGYTNICKLLLSYYTKDMIEKKMIDEHNEYGWTALMFAARNNHPETVKFLIEKGADKNYKTGVFFETVIGIAAHNGANKAIEALLEKGVSIEQKGFNGYTPLMYAVNANQANTVYYLLSDKKNINAKADVNATDIIGGTPLMLAAALGHYKILQMLIANKAKIDTVNEEEKTALMFAAENGNYDSVAYLLSDERKEKAKINMQDIYGKTALTYALENGHAKTAELIKSKGGR